jgi:hypothetical protein
MRDTIPSSQCGAPARISERFWLGSTAGPVEHVRSAASQPLADPLAEAVASAQPDPSATPAEAVPA